MSAVGDGSAPAPACRREPPDSAMSMPPDAVRSVTPAADTVRPRCAAHAARRSRGGRPDENSCHPIDPAARLRTGTRRDRGLCRRSPGMDPRRHLETDPGPSVPVCGPPLDHRAHPPLDRSVSGCPVASDLHPADPSAAPPPVLPYRKRPGMTPAREIRSPHRQRSAVLDRGESSYADECS